MLIFIKLIAEKCQWNDLRVVKERWLKKITLKLLKIFWMPSTSSILFTRGRNMDYAYYMRGVSSFDLSLL